MGMKGQYIDLATAKKIHRDDISNVEKSLIDANIKLVDENKFLKADIEILENKISQAVEYIRDVNDNPEYELDTKVVLNILLKKHHGEDYE